MVYNGHKRVHALKSHAIAAQSGLIANLFGPVEGGRHDSALLAMSALLNQFEERSLVVKNMTAHFDLYRTKGSIPRTKGLNGRLISLISRLVS